MIGIRPFQKGDAKQIVKWIHNEEEFRLWSGDCFKVYPLYAEDLITYYEQHINANYMAMVAYDEDGIFGQFVFRYMDDTKKSLRLGFVIVDDFCRGMGYGKAMLYQALTYAFDELHVDEVTLSVFTNNDAALHCYYSLGFEDATHCPDTPVNICGHAWIRRELFIQPA